MIVSSMSPDGLRYRLQAYLNERACGFTIGTRGALAEFRVEPDDVPRRAGLAVWTAGGAIALAPPASARLVDPAAGDAPPLWGGGAGGSRLEIVLPGAQARTAGRSAVTEVGPDRGAVRPADRDAVLFDLGLGLPFVDVCVRSRDAAVLALLRGWGARPLGTVPSAELAALKRASPHRVFVSRIGRIEVYQAIPGPHERSPPGPHTHLHPSRVPAAPRVRPTDLVSGLTVYPAPAPLRRG